MALVLWKVQLHSDMNILKQTNFFYVEIVFAQFFSESVMMPVSGLSIYIFLVTYETQAFNLA